MKRFPALALLGVLPVLGLLGLARATAPPPSPPAPPATWFSEEAYEIVRLAGAWSVHCSSAGTRFRPVGQAAQIELLDLSTGLVSEHEVPLAGELAVGHGWIVVNEVDQETF